MANHLTVKLCAFIVTTCAVGALSSALASPNCSGDELKHPGLPTIDTEELVIDWHEYIGRHISIAAYIQCESEDYCVLLADPRLRRVVQVDIEMLCHNKQRRAVLSCHDVPCQVWISGVVRLDDFEATEMLPAR